MSDDITTERIVIGPELATEMLDHNNRNRRLSNERVAQYAAAMRQGLWQFDGSPIRFDVQGNVIDGQHRLWAIVETELSFEFLVIRNLPSETFATIDTGKARNFGDMISIEFPSAVSISQLAATTAVLYRWSKGERGAALQGKARSGVIPGAVLMEYLRPRYDYIVDIGKRAARVNGRAPGLGKTTIALGMHIFDEIDREDSEYFFDRLTDGEALPAGSPILALRKLMAKHVAAKGGDTRTRIDVGLGTALLIKAWNAYRDGEQVYNLGFRAGGAKPERWPVAK